MQQAIRGTFGEPVVEKPRFLRALARPVLKLYKRARDLLPAGPYKIFYTGSVAPPSAASTSPGDDTKRRIQ